MFSAFKKSDSQESPVEQPSSAVPAENETPSPANFSEHAPDPTVGAGDVALTSSAAPEQGPAPEPTPEQISNPAKGIGDLAASAMGSPLFAKFIDDLTSFLDITDIENPNHRRAAVVSRKLGEEGIKEKLHLAHGFFYVQAKFAMANGMPELVDVSETYLGKIEIMKKHLGI